MTIFWKVSNLFRFLRKSTPKLYNHYFYSLWFFLQYLGTPISFHGLWRLFQLLFTPSEFFTSVFVDDFHWSLSDSKSPQVSRACLRILAVLSNAVVWIVSTRPPTFKSSRPFNNPLVIVPKAPITIGTIVTFMLHSFFQFSSKVEVLILLFPFLQIYSVVSQNSKVDNFANSLFLVDY